MGLLFIMKGEVKGLRLRLVGLLLIVFILVGCSSKVNSKPYDIRDDIWNDGIQYTILIHEMIVNNREFEMIDINNIVTSLWLYTNQENQSESEKEVTDLIRGLYISVINLEDAVNNNNETEIERNVDLFLMKYSNLGKIFGKGNIKFDNFDNRFPAKIINDEYTYFQEEQNRKKEEFMDEHRLELTYKDIKQTSKDTMYTGRVFYLEGNAKLCERNYISVDLLQHKCIRVVTPDDNNSWYLSVFIKDHKDFLDVLASENKYVRIRAIKNEKLNVGQLTHVEW